MHLLGYVFEKSKPPVSRDGRFGLHNSPPFCARVHHEVLTRDKSKGSTEFGLSASPNCELFQTLLIKSSLPWGFHYSNVVLSNSPPLEFRTGLLVYIHH